jgi:DNA repair protein RecO (recombination protein O)
MTFQDEGILLGLRPFGETSQIATFFTQTHGLHRGMARVSSKNRAAWQPGCLHKLQWQGRLAEQLGYWQGELLYSPLASLLSHPGKLAVFRGVMDLIHQFCPEHQGFPSLYQTTVTLLKSFDQQKWPQLYCQFEQDFLKGVGVQGDWAALSEEGDLKTVTDKTLREAFKLLDTLLHRYVFTPHGLKAPEAWYGARQALQRLIDHSA